MEKNKNKWIETDVHGTLVELYITDNGEPNLLQIWRQMGHYRDQEGVLYTTEFPTNSKRIGEWRVVNVEAKQWREVASRLYKELKWATECCYEEASSADRAIEILKEVEIQLNMNN